MWPITALYTGPLGWFINARLGRLRLVAASQRGQPRVSSRRSWRSWLGVGIQVRAMNAIEQRAELACRLAELRRLADRPKPDQH